MNQKLEQRINAEQIAELITTGYAIPIIHEHINMVYCDKKLYYYNGEDYSLFKNIQDSRRK